MSRVVKQRVHIIVAKSLTMSSILLFVIMILTKLDTKENSLYLEDCIKKICHSVQSTVKLLIQFFAHHLLRPVIIQFFTGEVRYKEPRTRSNLWKL